MAARTRKARKFFVFLREHRHELLDATFQDTLAEALRAQLPPSATKLAEALYQTDARGRPSGHKNRFGEGRYHLSLVAHFASNCAGPAVDALRHNHHCGTAFLAHDPVIGLPVVAGATGRNVDSPQQAPHGVRSVSSQVRKRAFPSTVIQYGP